MLALALAVPAVRAGPDGGVREYQSLLRELGYYRGPVDGIAGPLTRAAVLRFQRDHGLAADGVVGPATLSALRRAAATYVVRRGDNLSRIASRYGVSVDWLCGVNGIRDPDLIRPGQRLIVRDLPGVTGGAPGKAAGQAGGSGKAAGGAGKAAGSGSQGSAGGGAAGGQPAPAPAPAAEPAKDTVSGSQGEQAWQTFLPGVPPTQAGATAGASGLRGARVALTFNDAPHESTAALLDVLGARNVKATFFLVGERVGAAAEQVRRMAAAGHELGNHSYGHRPLAGHNAADVEKDLAAAQAAVRRVTGRAPRYFRPPGGAIDRTVASVAARLGLTTALWHNVGLTDDLPLPPEELARRIASRCRDGYIVMLHADRPATAQVVDHLIGLLAAAGARLVTLSELGGP